MIRLLTFAAALALLSATAEAQTLTAFPNPYAGGPLTVQADAPDASFELIDVLGRQMDVRQPLAPGAYLWRLRYADGSASTARPLTLASRGPLDVRLVHDGPAPASLSASVPRRADRAAKGDCSLQPGGALFGGFYHRPALGVEIHTTANRMTVQGAEGAAFSTCLPGVSGFNIGMPPSASAWSTDTPTNECVDVTASGHAGGTPVTGSYTTCSTTHLKQGGGASAEISGGLDPAKDRLVEVIRYDAEGAPSVVASAVIPGGTPLSTPFGRVSSGYLIITMTNITAAGWKVEEGESLRPAGALLDSVFVTQFDFGTNDPSGLLTFQIPGATVQGHALALTAQIDGLLALDLMTADASTMEFEVASLYSTHGMRTEIAQVETAIPAWLQMQDPNGLYSTSSMGTEIRCGQGKSCASYGVAASPSFATWTSSTGTLAPESILSSPTAQSLFAGPFESAPGRGLLTDRGDRFTTRATYGIMFETAPATLPRTATVEFGKPRLNKTSLRMEEECADELTASLGGTPCEPSFDRFELRYIQDGEVLLSKVLPAGRTITFKARLEILDGLIAFGAPEEGPVFRHAVSFRGGDEFLELRPATSGVTLGYTEVEWTYSAPWSFGFASTAGGNPTVLTAPLAEAAEDWAFEIE